MAAKKNSKQPAPKPEAATEQAQPKKTQTASFDAFEGDEVNTPDIDGWYSPIEGEAGWVGRIAGMFKRTDDEGKQRDIVVVRLLSDCSSATIEGEPVELEAGQVMAVGVKAKLRGLLEYVERRATVAVRATEKIKIGKGRSMWNFSVKGQKGARVALRPEPQRNQSADFETPDF